MVLSKIQTGLLDYKKWLLGLRQHPGAYKWETVRQFQLHWDLKAADPAQMYDQSLQNSETRRLWQTERWEPKRVLTEFWRFEPATVRALFEDLFNESFAVENRASRFIFGCDALLADYKRAHPLLVVNNHYHGDYRMIALYLGCRYPESYAFYDLEIFRAALIRFQAREIPEVHDLARYFKVLRTLMTFIEKDPELVAALQRFLLPNRHYRDRSLLFAEDFCQFLARR
ncbi:MAG: hypothetical protein ACR2K1_12615 [Saprospiraceae bacterium]